RPAWSTAICNHGMRITFSSWVHPRFRSSRRTIQPGRWGRLRIGRRTRSSTITARVPGRWSMRRVMRKIMRAHFQLILVVGLFLALAGNALSADNENGKVVFQACVACHTEKPDAVGPSLRSVFGRKSAALEDFRYSSSMQRANLVWDEANLRAYILDP